MQNNEQNAQHLDNSGNAVKPIVSGGASPNRITYVRNCFWWIEQYFEGGNVSKREAIDAVSSLMTHIEEHRR